MLVGIGCITGWSAKRFIADVVDRFVKLSATAVCVGDFRAACGAASALDHVDGEGFPDIQRRWIDAGNHAAVDQRNLD